MILVGDVGGTRTRLAFAAREGGEWRLCRLEETKTAADITALVADFVRRSAVARLQAAAFCGAGPVAPDGVIQLTNAAVRLDPSGLARAAGTPRALLINDFGAIAQSIPHLPRQSLVHCGGGERIESAPVVLIGPGTGLGVAIAMPGIQGWVTMTSEAGHADLAPVDDQELEIWRRLRSAHGRVSAETVLCGPGLERLYAAITDGAKRPSADIAASARDGEDAAARAVAHFTRWLGRVAGNLALTVAARGGVYIASGIVPRWGRDFDAASFRRAFEDKPPYSDWLRQIPSFVVTHPQPGLIGLAALAESSA
jgi:glucokinase